MIFGVKPSAARKMKRHRKKFTIFNLGWKNGVARRPPPKNSHEAERLTKSQLQKRSKVRGLAQNIPNSCHKLMMNLLEKCGKRYSAHVPVKKILNIYVDSFQFSLPQISPVLSASGFSQPFHSAVSLHHHITLQGRDVRIAAVASRSMTRNGHRL